MREIAGRKMENFRLIQTKLTSFIRKYYLNQLLKGSILFIATGLVYFIAVLLVEHFLWLGTTGRAILFWIFLLVEISLFVNFILFPLGKLFRLSKGIDNAEASKIIGKHFPEVNDKLLNVLQLNEDKQQSELLLAGIEQKSRELQPVPFGAAIDFKANAKYLKYAAFPIILILATFITGNSELFADSYTRVLNYKTAYEPPAPFQFILENEKLEVRENEKFTLKVNTIGEATPGTVSIHFNDNTFYLKAVEPGVFEYEFIGLRDDVDFRLTANGVSSGKHKLEVLKVPKLVNFELLFDYPDYTGKQNETISGTGNATIPEGTTVRWNFETRATDVVEITAKDSVYKMQSGDGKDNFSHQEILSSNFGYQISTSNAKVKDYEKLDYQIEVIRDEHPEIKMSQKTDTTDNVTRYFRGTLSDDYAISALQLVYYPENEEEKSEIVPIDVASEAFAEFHYTFPGNLELEKGNNYIFFFRVFDNDGVNGAKSTKSEIYSFRQRSDEELKEEKLEQQGKSIENLSKSLEAMKLSEKELEEISTLQKQKENLNYNERKQLDDFLKRQKQQSEMMKNYSEKLKRSFEETEENVENDGYKEELKERIERNEKRLEENEELLKELEEYSDKINREELGEKLEKLSKKNQNEQRNLEQLLELTKQYYVEEKARKLARDLEKLGEKQEEISEKQGENNAESQEKLSDEFEEFQEKMDELEEENQKLKTPKEMEREKVDEESIKQDQENAGEELEKGNEEKAKEKQKEAGQKMKEMSRRMQQQMSVQSAEQLDADIESLRQILENLVTFSFEQEEVLNSFSDMSFDSRSFAGNLKKQSSLREHFRHIDDSLYSLALKNPMINEEITKNLTDIEFDIDKSLERLAEGELPQGTASQQYVVTGANNLAYLLSNILSNLQNQANMNPGSGDQEGEEFQLPDLIEKQEELQEQLEEGMKNNEGKPKDGKEGEEGESQNESESGELFEIYKQQQELREQLKDLMEKEGGLNDAKDIEDAMEKMEEDLLNKGFDQENIERMNNLRHELMKFEDARLEQGEDNERTSSTNEREYKNQVKDQNLRAKEYFNSTEILNRQILPLRQIYKQKVKVYFEGGND